MLNDVVVDTNVFLHAQNPSEIRFGTAREFLTLLLAADTKLCVDGLFDPSAPHLSLIGHEYLDHIPPTGPGYAILVRLLQTDRVKMNVPTRVLPPIRRRVVSLIPRDPRDRTFVFVASNSQERILVSHDWVDYTPHVREEIKRLLEVVIEEASEALTRLSPGSDTHGGEA